MTNYSSFEFYDDEHILSYVYELNWHLPRDIQLESMDILVHLPPDKVDLLIPKYSKACWENAVAVIKKIGYPRNEKALAKLAEQLQDRNWPGALDGIEVFRDLGKVISTKYIEIECEKAIKDYNADWCEHLFFACDRLGLIGSDFKNSITYNKLKELAESLE